MDPNKLELDSVLHVYVDHKDDTVFCLVNYDDWIELKLHLFRWRANRSMNGMYYIRGYNRETKKDVYIHNVIIPRKAGMVVDHINRNTFDNRRENLRLVDYVTNNLNRELPCKSKTQQDLFGILHPRMLRRKTGKNQQKNAVSPQRCSSNEEYTYTLPYLMDTH